MTRHLSDRQIQRARRLLAARDPKLGALIARVGRCRLADSRRHDPFAGLVRVILSQQLSSKVAETLFARVVSIAGGPEAVTPARLLAVPPDALRAAGVSRPKIGYIRDLAARVSDGRLNLTALDDLSDDAVSEALTEVRGLGRWSAEMFLIFRLNRPDILPVGDLGIVKGMQQLFGMRRLPKPRTMVRLAEPWRPYRSIASWYLWRLHD